MPSDVGAAGGVRARLRIDARLVRADARRPAFADLPEAARRYIARLEEVSGVPAAIVSTGSERDHTIVRDDVIGGVWRPAS